MIRIIPLLLALAVPFSSVMATSSTDSDSHYNAAGFFDIHVCNWPDRPLFFMILFSSYEFAQIKSIKVYSPEDEMISQVPLDKFRLIQNKDKPEKRVFIRQEPVKPDWQDGWYSAKVEFKNGKIHEAEDFVVIKKLPIASATVPKNNADQITLTNRLSWNAVPGAKYYQVFLRDLWNDDKLIFQSKLLDKNEVVLPDGLLEPDGMYAWKIHARDTNEHQLLGDFNHGSLSSYMKFSTEP